MSVFPNVLLIRCFFGFFFGCFILSTEAVRGSLPAVRALLSSALFPAGL